MESYFVDRDTGAPLAGGYVQFWKDADRTEPKLVYEKQNIGADPVTGQPIYQFVPLPDPVQLSGVGTPQDNNGNNITIYYYPYDSLGNVELYYVAVFNYLGVQQFTREGWPNTFATDNPGAGSGATENQISNPQFTQVLFDPALGLTINFTGSATTNVVIAPDWTLQIVHAGTGAVQVARTAIAGSANLPTNPPYILTITPGSNISGLSLIQKLPNTPGIWTPQSEDVNGFVAANMLLGPNSLGVSMKYAPSVGVATQILVGNNASSNYVEYSASTELAPSSNTDNADVGYVNIVISLPTTTPTLISSIQVIGINEEVTGVLYEQESANRQIDHLFNYYNSLLQAKPIPSYLTGWNFPLNPAQLGSSIAAQATGANTSYYGPSFATAAAGGWDNTIFFQTANSGLTISRHATGALKILAAAAGQHAIVTYVPARVAIEMLSRRKCVMVCANGSVAKTATVSLWYTKSSLPSTIGSNQSIVATLDANGYPATQHGTWIPVPRSGLSNSSVPANAYTNAAQFTIPISPSGAASFNQIPLSGWDMQGNTDIENATFFAIVVGTSALAMNDYMLYQDVTCQDGDIPTVSGAKTFIENLIDCQHYLEMSFPLGTLPAQNIGLDTGESIDSFNIAGSPTFSGSTALIPFKVIKYATPATIALYSPGAANAFLYDEVTNGYLGNTTLFNSGTTGFSMTYTAIGGTGSVNIGDPMGIHWVADSRLGQ